MKNWTFSRVLEATALAVFMLSVFMVAEILTILVAE
tara:strand:- start:1374 stop:1481 length:108 start_codon:yes stop_codon:yes gene_type:complete